MKASGGLGRSVPEAKRALRLPLSTGKIERGAAPTSVMTLDGAFFLAFVHETRHGEVMLDFRIALEARNPARGCWRHYRVEAGTDLFGAWVVAIGYGRIGSVGRSRSYVVRDEAAARRLTDGLLRRRATAPRRLGVAYRIVELIDPAGWAGSYEAMFAAPSSPATAPSGP